LVQQFQQTFPVPLLHIWQPDEGFQLAKIRNKGFAAASSNYIIQIDGDLILHRDFIKDHVSFAKRGSFTTGSRVLLTAETSYTLEKAGAAFDPSLLRGKNAMNGIRSSLLRNLFAENYKAKGKHLYYVKGCNMAFWKDDIIRVNGYNEAFMGWGQEDSEIAIRLMNAGVTKRFIKFGAVCYHLYHREVPRDREKENIFEMQKAITEKLTRSPKGIDQYLQQTIS
jgi:predicted glycosyltransferase involved in capsule biosynthesis